MSTANRTRQFSFMAMSFHQFANEINRPCAYALIVDCVGVKRRPAVVDPDRHGSGEIVT